MTISPLLAPTHLPTVSNIGDVRSISSSLTCCSAQRMSFQRTTTKVPFGMSRICMNSPIDHLFLEDGPWVDYKDTEESPQAIPVFVPQKASSLPLRDNPSPMIFLCLYRGKS